jgi:hypothetical protein
MPQKTQTDTALSKRPKYVPIRGRSVALLANKVHLSRKRLPRISGSTGHECDQSKRTIGDSQSLFYFVLVIPVMEQGYDGISLVDPRAELGNVGYSGE